MDKPVARDDVLNEYIEDALRDVINEYGLDRIVAGRSYLRLELTNITPALVGSWLGGWSSDPRRPLIEPPRPTDIIGKARWWSRAIVGGLVYHHQEKYLSLREAQGIINDLYGKIGSRPEDAYASKIRILVENLSIIDKYPYPSVEVSEMDFEKHLDSYSPSCRGEPCPPSLNGVLGWILASRRVRLGLLNKCRGYPPGNYYNIPLPPYTYRFRVTAWIDGKVNGSRERLLGFSLGLALLLTGIGRMTSRGYGKLLPIGDLKGSGALWEAFKNVYDRVFNNASTACLAEEIIDRLNPEELIPQRDFDFRAEPCYPIFHPRLIHEGDITEMIQEDDSIYSILSSINKCTDSNKFVSTIPISCDLHKAKLYFKIMHGLPRSSLNWRLPSMVKYIITPRLDEPGYRVSYLCFYHCIRRRRNLGIRQCLLPRVFREICSALRELYREIHHGI